MGGVTDLEEVVKKVIRKSEVEPIELIKAKIKAIKLEEKDKVAIYLANKIFPLSKNDNRPR